MAYPDFELILHAQNFPAHNCQPPAAQRRTRLADSNHGTKHQDCEANATQKKTNQGVDLVENDPTHLLSRPRPRRLLLSDLLNPIVQVAVGSRTDSTPTQPRLHPAADTPSPLHVSGSKKEKRRQKAGVFTARKAEERRKREERRGRRERGEEEEDGEGALACVVLLF